MNICIISGSARKNNNTLRVGKAIERLCRNEHHVSFIDFQQYDIPLLTQGDVTPESLNPFQYELVHAMNEAHIILVISPEYNWSTTPEILNWLHRFGDTPFKHLFDNKVFALVGVSTGKGGKTPALHITSILHKIISFMDLESIVSAKIFESHHTKEVLDIYGNSLGNSRYDAGLEDFTSYTLRIAERWYR
jgi:chromate reductase